MTTLTRWLALAVVCLAALLGTQSAHSVPWINPVAQDYERCWEAGDMECMERLFTKRAWNKQRANYERVFAKTVHRDIQWTPGHVTERRWFKRRIVVIAYHGRSDTATERRSLSGVIGFDLNKKGQIRKLHEIHSNNPEAYADLWLKVQEQAKQHRKATFGDAATTACALAKYGTGAEANPIARVVFGIGPIPGAFVWFTGADSLLQWSQEREYWKGLGPMSSRGHKVALGFRWAVVGSNALHCLL